MNGIRRRALLGLPAWLVALPRSWAQPAALPGPITIIVPFPAGGGTDALARLLATRLRDVWQTTVLVENKPGAGTTLATAAVARAAPDGRTLVMASFGHAVAPALHPRLGYDTIRSFSPVALVATGPNLLLVHPSIETRNVQELVALARREPGKLAYASFGNGTSAHLAGELFAQQAGIELLHVPYRGSAPAITDLIGGQVQLMFDGLPSLNHVKAGRLRALAVTSATRVRAAPELPTVAESGLPGFETGAWFGLLAPAATPQALVERMNADVRTVLRDDEVRASIDRMGFVPADVDPPSFEKFVESEVERWGQIVRSRGIKAE